MIDSQPGGHKILLAGLDAAGKTSIYKRIMEGADAEELKNLPPTRGISRNIHRLSDKSDDSLVIWDLGGQERYRNEYLQDTSVFKDTHSLIYVIDLQDDERFDISMNYFIDILDILKEFNPRPNVFVLMHKLDPNEASKLRMTVFETIKAFKKANKYRDIKIINYSTSIYSESVDYAFKKIFEQLLPGYNLYTEENGEILVEDLIVEEKEVAEIVEDLNEESVIREEIISTTEVNETDEIVMKESTFDKDKYQQLIDEERESRIELNALLENLDLDIVNKDEKLEIQEDKQELQKKLIDKIEISKKSEIEDIQEDNELLQFQSKLLKITGSKSDTSVEKSIGEVVEPFIDALTNYITQRCKKAETRKIITAEESKFFQEFCNHFNSLRSEFWNFIEQEDIKSYEISRKLPLIIEKFFSKLLRAAIINNLITTEERSSLNGIIIKLIYQL